MTEQLSTALGRDYTSLCETQTVLSPPNKPSESSCHWEQMLFSAPSPYPDCCCKVKTRSGCTDPILPLVIFTLEQSSGLFEALRTIGSKKSVTSVAEFKKNIRITLISVSRGSRKKRTVSKEENSSQSDNANLPTSRLWKADRTDLLFRAALKSTSLIL